MIKYLIRIQKYYTIKQAVVSMCLACLFFYSNNFVEIKRRNLELSKKNAVFIKNLTGFKKNFIKQHLFLEKNTGFLEYFKTFCAKQKAEINIETIETKNIHGLTTSTFAIRGFFWHDQHIFETIDEIHKHSPGFSRVLSIKISRERPITTKNPALKTEIICQAFSK